MLEIRAIIPSEPAIDAHQLAVIQSDAMTVAAEEIQADFENTVASWNEPAKFQKLVIQSGDIISSIDVYTEDEIYAMVNDGTQPHEILPVRAHALHFMTGGMTKTKPGALSSGPGSVGSNEVFTKGVMNPGITARDFDNVIKEEWDERLPDAIQAAIDRAVG